MISNSDLFAEELRKRREKDGSGISEWARVECMDKTVPPKELWRRAIRLTAKKKERRR